MLDSTKCSKSLHEDPNLCQAESEVSVEFLRRGVNTKENKGFGLTLHPAPCEGYPQKGKAPREVKLTEEVHDNLPKHVYGGEIPAHLNPLNTCSSNNESSNIPLSKPRTKSAANEEEPLFTVRTPLRQTEDQVSGCNKLRQTVNPHSRDMSHFASDQRNAEKQGKKGSFTFKPHEWEGLQARHESNRELCVNICRICENHGMGELGRNTLLERTPTSLTNAAKSEAEFSQRKKSRRLNPVSQATPSDWSSESPYRDATAKSFRKKSINMTGVGT